VTSPILSGQWKLSQELGLDNNTLRKMPHQTAKDLNFLARMVNVNRKEKGIKVQHWNKGPAHLVNKDDQIEALISEHRPHVLGLSGANFYNTHDIADINQDGYDVHLASTISNPQLNVARVVVYTHQSLRVKRRLDLENDTISSVWLEVGLPRQKKILMCHFLVKLTPPLVHLLRNWSGGHHFLLNGSEHWLKARRYWC
jgi:hypothetical protein